MKKRTAYPITIVTTTIVHTHNVVIALLLCGMVCFFPRVNRHTKQTNQVASDDILGAQLGNSQTATGKQIIHLLK
jgi:hypothetical protein